MMKNNTDAIYRQSRSLVFRVEQPKTNKQLKGLGTHISPAGLVGTHISRALDGLRRYSARPRTRTTRAGGAGGAKGGCGGRSCPPDTPHKLVFEVHLGVLQDHGFSTTVKLDKSLKIEFWGFRRQRYENGRWEFCIRVIKLFPGSYRI